MTKRTGGLARLQPDVKDLPKGRLVLLQCDKVSLATVRVVRERSLTWPNETKM